MTQDAAQRAEYIRTIVHGRAAAVPGVCGTVGVLMEPCVQCRRVDAAVAEAVARSWAPTCTTTGKKAVAGVCPEHGGDGCLMASAIVEAVKEREARLVMEIDEVERLRQEVNEVRCEERERVIREAVELRHLPPDHFVHALRHPPASAPEGEKGTQ